MSSVLALKPASTDSLKLPRASQTRKNHPTATTIVAMALFLISTVVITMMVDIRPMGQIMIVVDMETTMDMVTTMEASTPKLNSNRNLDLS